jgi:hypothetical protein
MANYDVTYSCGHDGVIKLYGKHEDRTRKIEWMKDHQLCPKCAKKQQQVSFLGELEKHGLSVPELTGSEKQIAWADDIRRNALIAILKSPLADQVASNRNNINKILATISTAKAYIDNRDNLDPGLSERTIFTALFKMAK